MDNINAEYSTRIDRTSPLPDYHPSPWPFECGGNRHQKAVAGWTTARRAATISARRSSTPRSGAGMVSMMRFYSRRARLPKENPPVPLPDRIAAALRPVTRTTGSGAEPIRKAAQAATVARNPRRTGRFPIPAGDAYIALLTAPERP